MADFTGNIWTPAPANNYVVGSDICNGFVAGNISDPDDWYLMGVPTPYDWPHPLLCGRILNSEGEVVLAIKRNQIIHNAIHARTAPLKDRAGFEIHDNSGKRLLAVETTFSDKGGWLYRIEGEFYGKDGNVQMRCTPDGNRILSGKYGFGMTGAGPAFGNGYTPEDFNLIQIAMGTGGEICGILTGKHEKKKIILDGHYLINCEFDDCELFTNGDCAFGPGVVIKDNCKKVGGPRFALIASMLGVRPAGQADKEMEAKPAQPAATPETKQ